LPLPVWLLTSPLRFKEGSVNAALLSFRDSTGAAGPVLVLCTVSVFEIYSATLHTKYAGFHTKQIFWISAGL